MAIDSYQSNINKGLVRALNAASRRPFDVATGRLVIFSDHHKGARDDADDFTQCEAVYEAALEHYFEAGHTLLTLGDVEELWEVSPRTSIGAYENILKREAKFYELGRYWRVYGNHDDNWSYTDQVSRHLDAFFPGIDVDESLLLSVQEEGAEIGELLLAHGHQGTTFSDRLGWLSRWAVRLIWRPFQRLTKIKSTTPSKDVRLRYKHDTAMYDWAAAQSRLALIAGHTHRPVFTSRQRLDELTERLESHSIEAADLEEVAQLKADVAFARAEEQPAYFNTGCCSFSDGSISGIEIEGGQLILVRWRIDSGAAQREVIHSVALRQVFESTEERLEDQVVAFIPLP